MPSKPADAKRQAQIAAKVKGVSKNPGEKRSLAQIKKQAEWEASKGIKVYPR